MHLNYCLFKIPRSNIYINLKETDIFHYFCFTWNIILVKCLNSAVVSRETKRMGILDNKTSEVSCETNEVYLKILRIKLQKRIKTLKIKKKLRQAANILLKMGFVTIFISFFLWKCLVFINNCKSLYSRDLFAASEM